MPGERVAGGRGHCERWPGPRWQMSNVRDSPSALVLCIPLRIAACRTHHAGHQRRWRRGALPSGSAAARTSLTAPSSCSRPPRQQPRAAARRPAQQPVALPPPRPRQLRFSRGCSCLDECRTDRDAWWRHQNRISGHRHHGLRDGARRPAGRSPRAAGSLAHAHSTAAAARYKTGCPCPCCPSLPRP